MSFNNLRNSGDFNCAIYNDCIHITNCVLSFSVYMHVLECVIFEQHMAQ